MGTLGKNRQDEEEGNTDTSSSSKKQATRKTFYCFTAYNVTNLDLLKNRMIEIGKKGIIGNEICPTTGREHKQCFIALKKPMRITELKLPYKPHIESCKGSEEQNSKYCKKEGDYWSFGYPKPLNLIEPNKWWQQEILNIMTTEPNDRTVHWYWSNKGGIGKSQFAKYCVVKKNCLFFEEGKKSDIMHLIFEAPEERLECMIIDVPRDNGNNVSYKSIESIKNGLIYSPKYEGGYKYFNSPHVFVFANEPPQIHRLSEDRWHIVNIDDTPFGGDEGRVEDPTNLPSNI